MLALVQKCCCRFATPAARLRPSTHWRLDAPYRLLSAAGHIHVVHLLPAKQQLQSRAAACRRQQQWRMLHAS